MSSKRGNKAVFHAAACGCWVFLKEAPTQLSPRTSKGRQGSPHHGEPEERAAGRNAVFQGVFYLSGLLFKPPASQHRGWLEGKGCTQHGTRFPSPSSPSSWRACMTAAGWQLPRAPAGQGTATLTPSADAFSGTTGLSPGLCPQGAVGQERLGQPRWGSSLHRGKPPFFTKHCSEIESSCSSMEQPHHLQQQIKLGDVM